VQGVHDVWSRLRVQAMFLRRSGQWQMPRQAVRQPRGAWSRQLVLPARPPTCRASATAPVAEDIRRRQPRIGHWTPRWPNPARASPPHLDRRTMERILVVHPARHPTSASRTPPARRPDQPPRRRHVSPPSLLGRTGAARRTRHKSATLRRRPVPGAAGHPVREERATGCSQPVARNGQRVRLKWCSGGEPLSSH